MSEPEKLERGLGLVEATSLNMTFMVGIGPFIVIPFIVQAMGGPQCIWAWVLGAFLALLDGCVWAELGAAMPQAGGSYAFLREIYGPRGAGNWLSFLYVWQLSFSAPLAIAHGSDEERVRGRHDDLRKGRPMVDAHQYRSGAG